MNAPIHRASLTARAAPVSSVQKMAAHATKGRADITEEKIAFYSDALETILEVARIAQSVENVEISHGESVLFVAVEHIRAHCALGVEAIYRMMNDSRLTCDEYVKPDRDHLANRCARALGIH